MVDWSNVRFLFCLIRFSLPLNVKLARSVKKYKVALHFKPIQQYSTYKTDLHSFTRLLEYSLCKFLTETFQNYQSEKKEREKKVSFKMQLTVIGISPDGKDYFYLLPTQCLKIGRCGFKYWITTCSCDMGQGVLYPLPSISSCLQWRR